VQQSACTSTAGTAATAASDYQNLNSAPSCDSERATSGERVNFATANSCDGAAGCGDFVATTEHQPSSGLHG
jgi:hypothetical protein